MLSIMELYRTTGRPGIQSEIVTRSSGVPKATPAEASRAGVFSVAPENCLVEGVVSLRKVVALPRAKKRIRNNIEV